MATASLEHMEAGSKGGQSFDPERPASPASMGAILNAPQGTVVKPTYEVEQRRGFHYDWLCFGASLSACGAGFG